MPGVEKKEEDSDGNKNRPELQPALSWPISIPDLKDAPNEGSLDEEDVGIVISLTKTPVEGNGELSHSESQVCRGEKGKSGNLYDQEESAPSGSRIKNGVRFYSEGTDLGGMAKAHKQKHFSRSIVERWKKVVERALSMEDPWSIYKIEDLPTEECIRHRYSSIRRKWVTDNVLVKMENESFARGAMRECFRLKKLSNFHRADDWSHAHNYVAKRYIAHDAPRDSYFEDVKLQMDAKLWAEEYNRHNPPKKVDIFQITILEFKDRPNQPLFHLEHFIEGEYTKYNSNSGFVSEACRQTPHAFSHFTFERSGHQLIVVDVQGVGDLYTDPQIHTVDGKDYGDGNLGTKGMALFFYTHRCNDICGKMGLTPFDLAPTERALQNKNLRQRGISETVCRGTVSCCIAPGKHESANVMEYLRNRTLSQCSDERSSLASSSLTSSKDDIINEEAEDDGGDLDNGDVPSPSSSPNATQSESGSDAVFVIHPRLRRIRFESELDSCTSSSGGSGHTQHAEREAYWEEMRKLSRPAGLDKMDQEFLEKARKETSEAKPGSSILGQVHLDMARYHELGRFLTEDEGGQYDRVAAWFHLECASKCGVMEAILTAARIYLGLPHDLLQDFTVEADENSEDQGLEWMEVASNLGDRSAMLFLAEAYEKGSPLGSERTRSYMEAIRWYERAAAKEEDDGTEEEPKESALCTVDTPIFQILAKMAELYRAGGYGLPRDPMKAGDLYHEAAEGAMESMKGKLATQYYQLAEEAWAEVEEE